MLIIIEQKRALTEYGILVNLELLRQGKTKQWLVAKLSEKMPDRYFDNSILYKILTGQVNSPNTISAINEILGI